MTLSHAIEQTPSLSSIVLTNLNAAIMKKVPKGGSFEATEKEIHDAFVEAEKTV